MKKLLLLVLLAFISASCCNKESEELDRFSLSSEEKAWIPYQKGQNITFVYSNGYEFDFKVDTRETTWGTVGGEHCGEGYISYEKLEVTMSSQSPSMLFRFFLPASEFEQFLEISFIGANHRYFSFLTTSLPDYTDLEIDGNMYHDVYELQSYESDTSVIVPQTIYYNKTDGIIKIILTDNETITLKK